MLARRGLKHLHWLRIGGEQGLRDMGSRREIVWSRFQENRSGGEGKHERR